MLEDLFPMVRGVSYNLYIWLEWKNMAIEISLSLPLSLVYFRVLNKSTVWVETSSMWRFRDWSKNIGVGRSIWKCGWYKTHGPPPPFGTIMADSSLKQGWKFHDPLPSYNMDVWFALTNPIKPCSVLDKICWYTATTNFKIKEIIPFTEKTNGKTEHFLFRWTLWILRQLCGKTRVLWNCLSQSICKFVQRQPIPTHYFPEMLRLILKETEMGTKTAVLIPLLTLSCHILKQQQL